MNSEIEREIMFYPEAEVEIRSADDSNDKQIADINYFIENDFDAIIVAPNEAEAITPVIRDAYLSGIPVVVFDRNVRGHDYTAWQGADNEALGRAAGELASKSIVPGSKIIEIQGRKGSTPADGRHEGFKSVSGLNVIADTYGNWNYEDAFPLADSLISEHPDVALIYAHNDRMAIAASDAARKHGVTPYIIGIDGAPEIGMKAVADSTIFATFLYPTEGQRLIRTTMAILHGEPFDTLTMLPATGAIMKSNVGALLLQNEQIRKETERMELLKSELNGYWEQHSSQTAFLYALIAIMVLLAISLFLIIRTFWQHRRHQAMLNEATASKLAFFTNVSHDLRTPLTLIAEPIEQMTKADNITDRQRAMMKIADKNIRILRRLINQILDFRKYENGKLELHVAQADVGALVRSWGDAFEDLARRRDISLRVQVEEGADFSAAIDVEKLERVFYNIVSNAFKYTPDNGTITVTLVRDAGDICLSVADTGKGISDEDLPMIFDRFFQADKVLQSGSGSGIGLVVAKAFVELHHGRISVKSTLGKGTRFEVTIPVRRTDNQFIGTPVRITSTEINSVHSTPDFKPAHASAPRHDTTVLVVDDNPDLCALVTDMLADSYTVITAHDGAAGLKKAAKYVPDLVICDVMMPGMDGIEFCRRLKAEITTSHIPVLMLTACAMDEQRVEGYRVGADGYMSKPFGSSVLLARVDSLIANRKLVRDLWGRDVKDAVPRGRAEVPRADIAQGPTDIDSEFYAKFLRLVEAEMGNPDMNVEDLAADMGLSRSQFYRKIKSLTNYSPVELLRRLRLTRAYSLLTSTEKTVSEIAYEVGFSTPAYFTKCFREAYGETPSDTRGRLS